MMRDLLCAVARRAGCSRTRTRLIEAGSSQPQHRDRRHAGSRDPRIADAYAGQLGAGGRAVDLQAALKVCTAALLTAGDSSHDGWSRLRARRNQLDGRLTRLTRPLSGTYDVDGQPVPVRRHHPSNPRRTRPTRFLRQ